MMDARRGRGLCGPRACVPLRGETSAEADRVPRFMRDLRGALSRVIECPVTAVLNSGWNMRQSG